MPRHVLVTGGAGFIGSHLVELLAQDGSRVSVVDDLSRGRRAWLHPDAELHEADVRDPDGVREVVARAAADVVVHLAALHYIPAVDGAPELAWDMNVNATRILLDALEPQPPELLAFASTAAVYPDRAGPIAETCPPGPLDLYGRTKLEAEGLLGDFGKRTGTQTRVARIFNVIGRRETNAHVVPELVAQVRRGETTVRLGNIRSRRDYTDVRDVAEALRRLTATAPAAPDVYNVGSGRSVSVAELVETCAAITGRTLQVVSDAQRRRAQDRLELCADARLLRETTGWEPRWALADTLADLLGRADAA